MVVGAQRIISPLLEKAGAPSPLTTRGSPHVAPLLPSPLALPWFVLPAGGPGPPQPLWLL